MKNTENVGNVPMVSNLKFQIFIIYLQDISDFKAVVPIANDVKAIKRN